MREYLNEYKNLFIVLAIVVAVVSLICIILNSKIDKGEIKSAKVKEEEKLKKLVDISVVNDLMSQYDLTDEYNTSLMNTVSLNASYGLGSYYYYSGQYKYDDAYKAYVSFINTEKYSVSTCGALGYKIGDIIGTIDNPIGICNSVNDKLVVRTKADISETAKKLFGKDTVLNLKNITLEEINGQTGCSYLKNKELYVTGFADEGGGATPYLLNHSINGFEIDGDTLIVNVKFGFAEGYILNDYGDVAYNINGKRISRKEDVDRVFTQELQKKDYGTRVSFKFKYEDDHFVMIGFE